MCAAHTKVIFSHSAQPTKNTFPISKMLVEVRDEIDIMKGVRERQNRINRCVNVVIVSVNVSAALVLSFNSIGRCVDGGLFCKIQAFGIAAGHK